MCVLKDGDWQIVFSASLATCSIARAMDLQTKNEKEEEAEVYSKYDRIKRSNVMS